MQTATNLSEETLSKETTGLLKLKQIPIEEFCEAYEKGLQTLNPNSPEVELLRGATDEFLKKSSKANKSVDFFTWCEYVEKYGNKQQPKAVLTALAIGFAAGVVVGVLISKP